MSQFCRCNLIGHRWVAARGIYSTVCARICCRGTARGSRLRADLQEMIRALGGPHV